MHSHQFIVLRQDILSYRARSNGEADHAARTSAGCSSLSSWMSRCSSYAKKFEMLACARSIMRSTAIPRLATTKDTQVRGPEMRTVTTTRGTSHLAMDRLLLFRWASKLDCVDIGVHLLSSMGGSDPRSVHRNMPGGKAFRSNQARSLDPAWAFAISAGQCAAKGMKEGDTGY